MFFRVLMLMLLVLASSLRPAYAETESAFDRIMRTGTIRCGYTSAPPFLKIDPNTGALSGIQYDIVNEMARRLEWKVEWAVEAGFSTAVADLQAGKYDMFCNGLAPSGVRAKFVDFTSPVFLSSFDVWGRADDHRFDAGIETLNRKDVVMAVIEGNIMSIIRAQTFPETTPLGMTSLGDENVDMLMAVISGKADFTVMERTAGENFIAQHPGSLRRLNAAPFWIVPYIYPILKGDSKLLQTLNTTILELRATGALDRILDAHKAEVPYLLHLPPLYANP